MSKKYYSLGNELASKDYVDTSIEEAKVETFILHTEDLGNGRYRLSQSDINKYIEKSNTGEFFNVVTKLGTDDDLRPTMMLSVKNSAIDFFYVVVYNRDNQLYSGDTDSLIIESLMLETKDYKVTTITNMSLDLQYPSAKAVYNFVSSSDNVILNNIASVYDDSATYIVGDYVLYNNILYVCNTDISVAENWTAAHWTQTTVMNEINTLKNDVVTRLAQLTSLPVSNMAVVNQLPQSEDPNTLYFVEGE